MLSVAGANLSSGIARRNDLRLQHPLRPANPNRKAGKKKDTLLGLGLNRLLSHHLVFLRARRLVQKSPFSFLFRLREKRFYGMNWSDGVHGVLKDPNGLSPEQDDALIVVECVAMACHILVFN